MNDATFKNPPSSAPAGGERLRLDEGALEAAKRSLEQGAVTPSYGPWREDIIKLLNDALATEIVCTLRYKRHYFTAKGLASPKIAEEFLVHAGMVLPQLFNYRHESNHCLWLSGVDFCLYTAISPNDCQ